MIKCLFFRVMLPKIINLSVLRAIGAFIRLIMIYINFYDDNECRLYLSIKHVINLFHFDENPQSELFCFSERGTNMKVIFADSLN